MNPCIKELISGITSDFLDEKSRASIERVASKTLLANLEKKGITKIDDIEEDELISEVVEAFIVAFEQLAVDLRKQLKERQGSNNATRRRRDG